jgi:uncharacterized repeat protein (TIGR03803 family)
MRTTVARGQGNWIATGGAVAATLLSLLVTTEAQAQIFSTLRSFAGADGSSPSGALVEGPDGNLYGTTQIGGPEGRGTVFGMTPTGALTMLYALNGPEGSDVFAPLLLARDGRLYGTTALGGPGDWDGKGTVFGISLDGDYAPLHFFSGSDGAHPQTGLIEDRDGWLYGSTSSGGDFGRGSVFALSLAGELRSLHAFSGDDGAMPLGELVLAADGWLYGTTVTGGANNGGTLFRISPAGDFAIVHAFGFDPPDGYSPQGGLVVGADGAIYGTTEFGGEHGYGTIFRLTADGTFTPLHSLGQYEGTAPLAGLIAGGDGKLYGTTSSGGAFDHGTVFAITPAGELTVAHAFVAQLDGGSPVAALVRARDGRLYGTTPLGGAFSQGTVFRIALPGPATTTPRALRMRRAALEELRVDLPAAATAFTLTMTTPSLGPTSSYDTSANIRRECRRDADGTTCTFALPPGAQLAAGSYRFGMRSLGFRYGGSFGFHLSYTSEGLAYEQADTF